MLEKALEGYAQWLDAMTADKARAMWAKRKDSGFEINGQVVEITNDDVYRWWWRTKWARRGKAILR